MRAADVICAVVVSFAFGAFVLPHASAAQVQRRPVLIEDMTWPEVRDAIASGRTTAIIYAGSTEQNGPHMALGKHNFIAHYAAQRIAEELGDALVYPTLHPRVVHFIPEAEIQLSPKLIQNP